jgi:quercetin dioxygenase-like cupin family protein
MMQVTYGPEFGLAAQPAVVDRAKVERLQEAMEKLPQAPGMDTDHFFAGGMYCRRMFIPKGNIIVSKVHKTEHLFIGCSGELEVAGQGDTYVLKTGSVVPSIVGTKRAVRALTDVVCMTVHKTDLLSTDGLEEAMMELDERNLYDVHNQPKPGVLVGIPDTQKLEA